MISTTTFNYSIPYSIKIGPAVIRRTLKDVRDQLLSRKINGGPQHLDMNTVCERNRCGTAACIGGWTSIFLLGFEAKTSDEENTISNLFDHLRRIDERLHDLFYNYTNTADYDEPDVAATAIQRYLTGKDPWPHGDMPNVLAYTKRAPTKKKK